MARLQTAGVILLVVITGLVSSTRVRIPRLVHRPTRRHTDSNVHSHTTPRYPHGPTSDWAFWTRPKTTMPPTTTTYCPYPCTHQGRHYCYPLPCYIRCVDAVRPPGSCCYECINGPNCLSNGQTIPEGDYITLSSGDQVHCLQGGHRGGILDIRHSTNPVTTPDQTPRRA